MSQRARWARPWRRRAAPGAEVVAGPAPELPAPATSLALDDAFLRRLERLALHARRVAPTVGGRVGRQHSPAADFVDHRAYAPGDDLRHLDWPALARHDAVVVKVGRVPQAAEVRLIVDVSPSMAAEPSKWRLAFELTAALAWLGLARGDRVIVQPWPATAGWGPASGAGRAHTLLAYLRALRPTAAGQPLSAAVRAVAGGAAGGALVVISDLWRVDDLDAALRLAPRARWERSVLQVLSPDELRPPPLGAVALVDSETGDRWSLTLDEAASRAYAVALQTRLDGVAAHCAGAGVHWSLVPSDWPLERAVLPLLQQRGVVV